MTPRIELRKKAPFTCRAPGHFTFPLAETDGDLCPIHEAESKALAKKADAPIPRIDTPAVLPASATIVTRRIWP